MSEEKREQIPASSPLSGLFSRLDPLTAILLAIVLVGGDKAIGMFFPSLSRPDPFTGSMADDMEKDWKAYSDKNRSELTRHVDDRMDEFDRRLVIAQRGVNEHNRDASSKIREYDQRLARLEAVCLPNGARTGLTSIKDKLVNRED